MPDIKLNKYNVARGALKARVTYSAFEKTTDGRFCVTIYAKDYVNDLRKIFALRSGYENNTDTQTDYFEEGRVRLYEGDPLFERALELSGYQAVIKL